MLRSATHPAPETAPDLDVRTGAGASAAAAQTGRALLVDSFVLSSNASGLSDSSLMRTEARGSNRSDWMSSRFQFRDDWPWEVRVQRK